MTRVRSWVVGEAEAGITLGDLLQRIDADARSALEQGGVFVGGRRVHDSGRRLHAGEKIEIGAPRPAPATPHILEERAGLVAVVKPAGLPTEPDRQGAASLLTAAAAALNTPVRTLHAVGRLDVQVSGIVLLARGPAARQRALRARASGALRKSYLGIAAGRPGEGDGVWRLAVANRRTETRWRLVAQNATASLLSLEAISGRKHQLRIHASAAGLPLYGDRRYGGPTRVVAPDGSVQALGRIALHATRLELGDWVVEAALPQELVALLETLGIER